MKKIISILFLCTSFFVSSFSQSAESSKAKTILDNVSAKTKSYSTIKVGFTFIHETKESAGKVEKTNGTLHLKGQKYQLSLLGNTLYCDGTTLWTHMVDEKEVVVSSMSESKDDNFNPAKMLTIYETGFKYKFIQERFEAGKALYVIDLFPKDIEKSEYTKVRLYINKDKSQIWKIEYHAKDKNKYTILVNSFETGIAMTDGLFKFDKTKHPGVTITDER